MSRIIMHSYLMYSDLKMLILDIYKRIRIQYVPG